MDGKPLEHWRVEVSSYAEPILALEPGMCAGKADLTDDDRATIRECAFHLLAFIGE